MIFPPCAPGSRGQGEKGDGALKEKLCIFGGTSEGRTLAGELGGCYDLTVCVATDYGREMLDGTEGCRVRTGRMDGREMEAFFRENGFSQVIDATHPYALEVSANIRRACERTGTPLLRVLRDSAAASDGVFVDSAAGARDFLAGRSGNILLTTGSKELGAFAGLDMSRVWARVLPVQASIAACEAAGIAPGHIIAMQGPFSQEMNEATLRAVDARWLVTKSAGAAGGFSEKIAAARAVGAGSVIIGRPPETEGVSLRAALERLLPHERAVSLVGIGPGGGDCLTQEARRALEVCDAVVGAEPVLDAVKTQKPKFAAFRPEDVRRVLEQNDFRRPAVVLRGDVGFFSGAQALKEALADWEVKLIPGIASPVYFAARLGIPWDGVKLLSLHGRDGALIRAVEENRRVMALTGGANTAGAVGERLVRYGLGDVAVTVGERLSYPDERITRLTARELAGASFDKLSILLIENPEAGFRIRRGIPDEAFVRGETPMTKAEVRAVCLSALAPDGDSLIWDVGAGTGSVSVECALSAPEGRVYAVERSPAACGLIRENALKFRVENLEVVEGQAPEALEGLPAPTHVFIGGSSGNLREIVDVVLRKNPDARIVAVAVTLETQAELTALFRQRDFACTQAVTVSVSRAKKAGDHHLMAAQNTVTVFTAQGGGGHE